MKTVGNLKDSISGLLTGTDLDNANNLNGAIERAVRIMSTRVDIPEASATENVSLYSGVYDYLVTGAIFGSALNDIRPQGVSRGPNDYVYKQPISLFDRTKATLPNGYAVTFEWNNGSPIARIATPKPSPKVVIDSMDEDTGWTAAGSASLLTEDETDYYQSPSSLRFKLTGASTGTLTKTLTNALSLSDYQNVGVAFLAIKIPSGATAAQITSIALKLGSSATVYDSVTSTTGFLGAWTVGDWLLVALDFSTATSTGAPNWAAINYVQVSVAHTATVTNFRVGGLFIALPSPHKLYYQSPAVFMHSGSNPSASITDDNDSIILNDAAYVIFEHEAAKTLALQNGGTLANGTIKSFDETLNGIRSIRNGALITPGLYDRYAANNPSNQLRQVGNYYED
jgi:hypothetical protein